eukprot:15482016-Alexandrium_andersonii.AAC.1
MSLAATVLLMKWAWGILSAVDVQELALGTKLGGNADDEMEELASLGAHGTVPGHCSRDLKRRFAEETFTPSPRSYRAPFYDHLGKKNVVLHTDVA